MAVSSLTLNYDAVLASTLFNLHQSGAITDAISTSNRFFFELIKGKQYTGDAAGNRMQINLLYSIANGDSYSSYDQLDVTPQDGITAAFFNWGQWAVPIAISGKEERENKGSETQAFDLLKAKTKQSLLGIQEGFAKAFIQGNGANSATAVATAYTSPNNASVFIDPLCELVNFANTASVSVGNINQNTYTWWRNQIQDGSSGATTFAGLLKSLDHLYNSCTKGPGGPPNMHICDQNMYEVYVAALRTQNRFPDFNKADIPFENVAFHGNALTWDQFIPDAGNATITGIPVAASGTWFMLNSQFFTMKYFLNFEPQPFIKPENQDAKVAQLLWHGGCGVSNRRKNGVASKFDTTITA